MTHKCAIQSVAVALAVGTALGASVTAYVALSMAHRYRNPRESHTSRGKRGRHAKTR